MMFMFMDLNEDGFICNRDVFYNFKNLDETQNY